MWSLWCPYLTRFQNPSSIQKGRMIWFFSSLLEKLGFLVLFGFERNLYKWGFSQPGNKRNKFSIRYLPTQLLREFRCNLGSLHKTIVIYLVDSLEGLFNLGIRLKVFHVSRGIYWIKFQYVYVF